MDIYETLVKLSADNEDGVSIKEMANETHYSPNRVRELLNQLLNSGHATRERSSTREYLYSPTEKKFDNITTKDIIFSDQDLKDWINSEIGENSDKFTVLYPENS